MGCSCSSPKKFKLMVNGKEKIIWGLDQIVFATILSFPANDQIAVKTLWQNLLLLNPDIPLEEESAYENAMLDIYEKAKKSYDLYSENS